MDVAVQLLQDMIFISLIVIAAVIFVFMCWAFRTIGLSGSNEPSLEDRINYHIEQNIRNPEQQVKDKIIMRNSKNRQADDENFED